MFKNLRTLLSLVLALALALTLCACGGEDAAEDTAGEQTAESTGEWYFGGNNIMVKEVDPKTLFEDFKDTVDPASIYASTEFTEEMLYGAYTLNDDENDIEKVKESVSFKDFTFDNGTFNMTTLPVAVYMGHDYYCNSRINYANSEYEAITDAELATLEFLTKEGEIGNIVCTYEVKGNKILFKNIEKTSAENEPFKYEYSGPEFEYTFEISGPYLTLKNDDSSLKLIAYALSKNCKDEPAVNGYSLPASPLIGDLDYFVSSDAFNYAVKRDGSYYDLTAFKLTADGKFTVYLEERDIVTGEKDIITEQYACVVRSDADDYFTGFRVILLDGKKQYYYTDDISDREARELKDQGVDTNSLTDEQIKDIAEKKSDLFDDLKKAFDEQGINATVNKSTGELALDASVLFGGDSANISDDGKALLNKFLKAYTSIVYNEKYSGFISKTMVEGHTAPLAGSTYESGLALSKERADNVKNYCLSADTGVDTSKLASSLEAVGLSNSKPVYDSNGEVDKAACRRVSFRMIVNVASVK